MVSETVKQILANAFSQGEIYHPVFEKVMITVMEVRVSADLKIMTAFITINNKEYAKPIINLLNEMSLDIRKLIK